jgi:hypothetical protein
MSKPDIKGRVDAAAAEMNEAQESAIRALGNEVHRLNQAVIRCVEAGLTVELQRTARHHTEAGHWGDMLVPIVVKRG